ncbi:SDR family NAD(P)-dependent oxidoreductase [Microbacterium sp. 77mftsu3.1]|uniref:SDR family NAD(P)-dependent oxidoreductase n=1 Tax=Microbacterium sp. 77mftsu3.1 TaxID=1761802 RepID=UPI00037753D8|nr:SDR family NAD(P)-dependent oxidoreductase [Microbacterium sp. 77mftsu3.1]SDG32084.1 Short-chain dehydrogenase [Microbacterium sp. 77mftsu3.1]
MRTIVITGASDGIGAAASRQLVARGHQVVLVGRSPEKTRAVANDVGMPHHLADFSDLAQVRRLADELLAAYPRIDVLANNAGGIFGPRKLTTDGFEQTFQVNHLGPFLLTNLLRERLVESEASIIQTASAAARIFSRFDINDLNAARRYSGRVAYGNAKLSNILFTRELQRRWGSEGISAGAFHPGVVATGFAGNLTGPFRFMYHNPLAKRLLTTTDEGGKRLVFLADGTPGTDWLPGAYYENDRVTKTHKLATDEQLARELWDRSVEMVKLG